jgi:general secretion pathway protein C
MWVNLALLALMAYWGAATVSTAIAAKLTPSPEVHLSPPPPPIAREPKRPATYYAAIQVRDIFNSTKPEPPKAAADPTPKPTELKLKLWGVVVHDDGASYCVIEDLTTHKQDLYRINDQVGPGAAVKQIDWDRVILDRDGQDEILDLASAPGAPAAPRPAAAAGAPGVQPSNPHIQVIAENQYSIDRSEVDSALDNMSQLFTQIRAVPHFEGGQSTGFRLFAIRQNSIFDQIGLRNGDIIQRINGTDLSDPGQALSLFQQLRNERAITVEVLRNKQNVTLSYQFKG